MYNPFAEIVEKDGDESDIIRAALAGDAASLEKLVLRHQAWIYNIAFRMVMSADDACDVTQEILIRMITRLSTYDPAKASFRTWLYRIAVNHVLSMKKTAFEVRFADMDAYFAGIELLPDERSYSRPDAAILAEETRISCMSGMLLCFSRRERLVFILGVIFGVSDAVGSEVMDISRANFRKILSRARGKLYSYMNEKCGLLNDSGVCRCGWKSKTLAERGYIDASKPRYFANNARPVKDVLLEKMDDFEGSYLARFYELFRGNPFYDPPDMTRWLRETLSGESFRELFHLQ